MSCGSSARSWSSWVAICSDSALSAPVFHRMYSSRCQPVNAGSSTEAKSSTRESTAPSTSETRPAIGSMVSQW